MISYILKRDECRETFNAEKVVNAIEKAMVASNNGDRTQAEKVANDVVAQLEYIKSRDPRYIPSVEGVQNIVEEMLMRNSFFDVAKSYIVYRDQQARNRKPDIFRKRINLKPYEYPQLLEYSDAIRHSYWLHTEFNFTADIQDFKVGISDIERIAITRTMLAISQVEVSVQAFWGKLADKMPKPEIASVGTTFAESEVRHFDAYSHLLEILGLNEEFENLDKYPVLAERVDYLEDALRNVDKNNNQDYAESILLFSLIIEHVSLFSQFLIIMAFNKYRSQLKGISNVAEATSKEEQIHGSFSVELMKIIKSENPSWFNKEHLVKVQKICQQAYESEASVVNWIFEEGEFDFMSKEVVITFIKDRFNRSLKNIDVEPIFEVDEEILAESEWFDDEIIGTKHGDFFVKRSINYNKRSKSITTDDLF